MGFYADTLSVTWILLITGVGSLIHLYSIGYMHGDERFSRFFAYLNLFVVVDADARPRLELPRHVPRLGGRRPLLLPARSFWFERNAAAVAGKKAFVTNRVGDVGFLLAMFLIFASLRVAELRGDAAPARARSSSGTATAIALLLLVAAVGKSAQIPLHLWLPDAMEGPTPVSALIHAATMVTAGVFLLCRAHVFFDVSSDAMTVVAWVGGITALLAGTVAILQPDIKRVLAYSTISQLGYMFLAVGIGAYTAAVFMVLVPRVLQGLPVPRCRLGDPRQPRQPGHADHGPVPQVHALHRGRHGGRVAGDRRRAAARRASSRRTRSSARRSSTRRLRPVDRRASSPPCSPRST